MENGISYDLDKAYCRCGAEFEAMVQSCKLVPCPLCGAFVKIGACA